MARYRPLADPLFLGSVALYFVGRLVLRDAFPGGFPSAHLNDLLLIPMWTPLLVLGLQEVGVRPREGYPDAWEIFLPLVVVAVVFEWILPVTPPFDDVCYRDVRDIAWYAAGGALGASWWTIAEARASTSGAQCSSP